MDRQTTPVMNYVSPASNTSATARRLFTRAAHAGGQMGRPTCPA
jgi:hypothetical protein